MILNLPTVMKSVRFNNEINELLFDLFSDLMRKLRLNDNSIIVVFRGASLMNAKMTM